MPLSDVHRPDGDPVEKRVIELLLAHQAQCESAQAVAVRRKRLSDDIFRTIDAIRRCIIILSQEQEWAWLKGNLEVPVNDQEEDSGVSHFPVVKVPRIAAITLTTAAKITLLNWQSISAEQEPKIIEQQTQEIIREMAQAQTPEQLIAAAAYWDPILMLLAADIEDNEGRNVSQLTHGLQPQLRAAEAEFYAKRKSRPADQMEANAAATLKRMDVLCSPANSQIRAAMGNWERWLPLMQPATPEHIPLMLDTYRRVMIPPLVLRNLMSSDPLVKAQAIERVESEGGFLHTPEEEALREMIECGVSKVIFGSPDTDAGYYGVLTDPASNERALANICGFERGRAYQSVEELPSKSALGWKLQWTNKILALTMFQNPDRVAVSVEVAVRPASKYVDKRDAGLMSAFKHQVYVEVPQDFILTRHFEILAVNGTPVPSAVNMNSALVIQAHGGKFLGTAEEEFDVAIGTNHEAKPVTIRLAVQWHLCLARREESIRRIERKKKA